MSPWVQSRLTRLEMRLQAAEKEKEGLRAKLVAAGADATMEVDEGPEPSDLKAQLDVIEADLEAIKSSKYAGFGQARADLEAQRNKLRAEMLEAKPIPQRFLALQRKETKLVDRRARQQEALDRLVEQQAELAEKVRIQQSDIAATIAELAELHSEKAKLGSRVVRPPEDGKKSGLLEGFASLTPQALQEYLGSLGDADGAVHRQMLAAVDAVKALEELHAKAQAEEAAKREAPAAERGPGPSDQGQPGYVFPADDVDINELRAFMQGMGHGVDKDAPDEEVRKQYKRTMEFFGQRCKKARVQEGGAGA